MIQVERHLCIVGLKHFPRIATFLWIYSQVFWCMSTDFWSWINLLSGVGRKNIFHGGQLNSTYQCFSSLGKIIKSPCEKTCFNFTDKMVSILDRFIIHNDLEPKGTFRVLAKK